MPRKRLIAFSPHDIPTTRWGLNLTPPIPRSVGPELCERLHELSLERDGADHFYPGYPTGGNTARFEWYLPRRGDRFAIRVGIVIQFTSEPIASLIGYADLGANLVERRDPPTPLEQRDLQAAQEEASLVANLALGRLGREADSHFRPVFHIACPPLRSFRNVVTTDDGVIIFPTRILGRDNDRVSAVSFPIRAYTQDASGTSATATLARLNAVLTVAYGAAYKPASLRWPSSPQRRQFLAEGEEVSDVTVLYPAGRRLRMPTTQELIGDTRPFTSLWQAVRSVPEFQGSAVENALFALARSLELGNAPTLAVVCQLAALGALAHDLVERCAGQMTCSIHGKMMPHNTTGDAAAIIKLSTQSLQRVGVEFEEKDLAKIVRRTYAEQRSSFAHEAVVRHRENDRGNMLAMAGPGPDSPSTVDLQRSIDARYIAELTRRVVVARLGELGGTDVSSALPKEPLRAAGQYGAAFRIPRGAVVRLDVRGPPDTSTGEPRGK